MSKPEVSILMSAFNVEKYIAFAIESVINQTYKNWELIIIDDASNDKTPEIVNKYKKKDKRIRYHSVDCNQGSFKCLNQGILLSSGKYIANLDSDDIWIDKNKLERQIKFLNN